RSASDDNATARPLHTSPLGAGARPVPRAFRWLRQTWTFACSPRNPETKYSASLRLETPDQGGEIPPTQQHARSRCRLLAASPAASRGGTADCAASEAPYARRRRALHDAPEAAR